MINGNKLLVEFINKGFYFNEDILFNYYVSLVTKPFVILTGISGSGKSKIAEIFSEVVTNNDKESYELVPVKPNWRDNKGLFGYHNVIDDSYYITPMIKLFLRALSNPEKPYFLILDEMNIAQVEHYFSDYLSLIESRRLGISNDVIDFDTFVFGDDLKLSEALILSALDIGKNDQYLEIREYRENRFTQKWKKQIFKGKEESWTPQVRTELNQKDAEGNPSRLAGRVFEGGEGKYRIKDKNDMSPEDRNKFEALENLYSKFVSNEQYVVQDNINLHNCNMCISPESGKKCDCLCCTFDNSEKYKCPNLYNPDSDTYLVPPEMPIPLNIFTIGTVNVDETTYMFSPKVLDRSNVIEFNEIDFDNVYKLTNQMKRLLGYSKIFSNKDYYFSKDYDISEHMKISLPSVGHVNNFIEKYPEEYSRLLMIFSCLKKYNLQFGYRVMNEISAYIINAVECSNNTNCVEYALDLQISQKILPKLHGSYEKLWNPLVDILSCCLVETSIWEEKTTLSDITKVLSDILEKEVDCTKLSVSELKELFKYPKSASKIIEMLSDLDLQGFATFIR